MELQYTKWAEIIWPAALYTAPRSGAFATTTP